MAPYGRSGYSAAVVDTEEKLASFLPTLEAATWVAVDTEADSLHAYPEKVCLIQISTALDDRLVDPLAGMDLVPLLNALAPHELIMHGADYDLRLLNRHHNFVPKRIFDTMIAARLLGIHQFSLSHLVEHHLGVKLEKGPQKANWALRPLTKRMEAYARNDTRYLKPLSDKLGSELQDRGRLEWHRESCARLIEEAASEAPQDLDLLWRMKGSQALPRLGLAVLRELWRWREREARAANRPPFFILSHDAVMEIATKAAAGQDYKSALPRHLSDRRAAGIARAVEHALDIPQDQHPRPLKYVTRRPSEGEKRRYQEIRKRRDAVASKLGLDAALIASRSVIAGLAHDWDKHSKSLMKWQRELLEDQA